MKPTDLSPSVAVQTGSPALAAQAVPAAALVPPLATASPIRPPTPIPLVSQLSFVAMATTAMAPTKAVTSVFASVPEAPADPILGLNAAFLADEAPEKISLGVGAFRTDEGKPYVLPVVKRVEQQLVRLCLRPLFVFGWGRGREVGACCAAS